MAGYAIGAGLVVLGALGAVVGGGAAYETLLVQPVLSSTSEASAAPLFYVGSIALLTEVFAAAGWLMRRDPRRWGFAGWLVAVATSGVLVFAWFALLSAGLRQVGHETARLAEAWEFGLFTFAAVAGPSIASLVASVCVLSARWHRIPPFIAPLAFLVVMGASAVPIIFGSVAEREHVEF